MKPEVKELILKVISSYHYGHGAMRRLSCGRIEHCIIGMLYEEFKKLNPKSFKWYFNPTNKLFYIHEKDEARVKHLVCKWAGLTEHEFSLLAVANDTLKKYPIVTLQNL